MPRAPRRRRARLLWLAWGALCAMLAALALECRRGPSARAAASTFADVDGARTAAAQDRLRHGEREPDAVRARRFESSQEACVLTGTVYGRDGKPVAEATVTADALTVGPRRFDAADDDSGDDDDEIDTRTDENGAFEIEVPPGDYALTARDEADAVSDVIHPLSLGVGERLDGLELHLGGGATVAGRVELGPGVEDEGEITLCAMIHERDARCRSSITVEDDGSFRLDGLPARPLWLRASTPSGALATQAVLPPALGVTLRLSARPVVAGVVSRDGVPAGGAEVTVTDADGRFLDSVTVDDDGAFELRVSYRGAIVVWARSDDNGVSARSRVDSERARDLTLILRDAASVSGRVVGEAASEMTVALKSGFGRQIQRVVIEADGSYRFTAVPPGRWTLALTRDSDGPSPDLPSVEVDVAESGELRAADLFVDRARTIRGRVVDGEGHPVAGAEVDVLAADGTLTLGAEASETGADGSFELDAKVVGPVVLRASGSGQVGDRRRVAATPGRDEEWVELTLFAECQVSGVIRGSDGFPRPEARVICGGIERSSTGAGRFDMGCACHTTQLRVDDGRGARLVPVKLTLENDVYVEVRL